MTMRKTGRKKFVPARFQRQISRNSMQARPRPAASTAEFIARFALADVVEGARALAREHFGEALTGVTETLGMEGSEQFLEVEAGIWVDPEAYISRRAGYLKAVRRAFPDVDRDRLLVAVRMRAPAV